MTGSVNMIDSSCDTCGIVMNGTSSMILENIKVTNSGPTLVANGVTILSGSLVGKTYAVGHVFRDNGDHLTVTNGTFLPYTKRGSLTDSSGMYYSKAQPQYTNYPISAFASVKDLGAKGLS